MLDLSLAYHDEYPSVRPNCRNGALPVIPECMFKASQQNILPDTLCPFEKMTISISCRRSNDDQSRAVKQIPHSGCFSIRVPGVILDYSQCVDPEKSNPHTSGNTDRILIARWQISESYAMHVSLDVRAGDLVEDMASSAVR